MVLPGHGTVAGGRITWSSPGTGARRRAVRRRSRRSGTAARRRRRRRAARARSRAAAGAASSGRPARPSTSAAALKPTAAGSHTRPRQSRLCRIHSLSDTREALWSMSRRRDSPVARPQPRSGIQQNKGGRFSLCLSARVIEPFDLICHFVLTAGHRIQPNSGSI